jgi:hypothetical protein
MLRIFGLLFIALLLMAGMGIGYWVHQDRQARAFVAASIPVIYKEWDAAAVMRRSARTLQKPEFEAQVREMFATFGGHLGSVVSAEAPEGTLHYGRPDPGLPQGLYGEYSAGVTFEQGEGQIRFTVIKEQGAWRIARFAVESPAMLEAMRKQTPVKGTRPGYDRGPPDEEAAVLAAAEEIFRLIDSEVPATAWNRGSIPFQQAKTKRRFEAEMKRLHETTGHVQSRKLQGIGFRFDLQSVNPPGDYAIADFISTYSRATLRERLGFYRKEGTWQFSGHDWSRVEKE